MSISKDDGTGLFHMANINMGLSEKRKIERKKKGGERKKQKKATAIFIG